MPMEETRFSPLLPKIKLACSHDSSRHDTSELSAAAGFAKLAALKSTEIPLVGDATDAGSPTMSQGGPGAEQRAGS
jgi:hypothetical protein